MKIEITDTSYGGYGVGKDDSGKVIFVSHAVEGDTLEVEIVKHSKKFSHAKIKNIIIPSPDRIEPKCEYASLCGGCVFSHIDYEKQIDIKKKIVLNAIRKCYSKDLQIVKSVKEDYRLRGTLLAKNGSVGFYKFNTRNFTAVENCIVFKKSLFEKIKLFAKENNITGSIYAIETDRGIAFSHIKDNSKNIKHKKYFDGFTHNKKIYGLTHAPYKTLHGDIGVSHKTFFQANRFLIDEFQNAASEYAKTEKNVVELYGGSGFFTSALIKKCGDVLSSEIDDEAAVLASIYGYKTERSDAADFLKNINHAGVIFVDPPREGLSQEVIKNIMRIKPQKIVYVSCDPMTLGRDSSIFSDLYSLEEIVMFDMFAETYHVETVSLFMLK